MSRDGPILIAFDGSDAAEHAMREAAGLLARNSALVVVVWKQGIAWELMELPTATVGLPPASIDVATALETDEKLYEGAQRLARKGAALARDAGFEAEGLAVADDLDVPVAETLLRVARERDAAALAMGTHGHGAIGELLGSTTRGVLKHADLPVVVVRYRGEQPSA
jgi:nucleotide-binding universal stress UspA family protein